jgi:hypothetical protein
MSKNGGNNSTEKNNDQPKSLEHPKAAVNRLTGEIISECKLIATGCTESCYMLVEKTKQLMDAESKI